MSGFSPRNLEHRELRCRRALAISLCALTGTEDLREPDRTDFERVASLLHAARQKGSVRTLLLTDLAHPWALALESRYCRGPLFLPGQTVLDLGCGTGDVSGLLAARGLNVTGVDANGELLAAISCDMSSRKFCAS